MFNVCCGYGCQRLLFPLVPLFISFLCCLWISYELLKQSLCLSFLSCNPLSVIESCGCGVKMLGQGSVL